ncbi:hypothetical protein X777_05508 [Ooceraea biroi]|uniref:Uncharacterized protein n=1 Tax=Ooceraea biroi TaxID=2015173 RepID=A0A026WHH4_OOCBI|nr:hypothetical protein X777_05508 [Ooceraea biroi]
MKEACERENQLRKAEGEEEEHDDDEDDDDDDEEDEEPNRDEGAVFQNESECYHHTREGGLMSEVERTRALTQPRRTICCDQSLSRASSLHAS